MYRVVAIALFLSFALFFTATSAQMTRGERWIREHPFQISAFIEFPVNLDNYKEIGFTSLMATLPPGEQQAERIFGAAAETGLGWHWFYRWHPDSDIETFLARVNEYRQSYPGNLGLVVGDECPQEYFPEICPIIQEVRELAPDALVYHAMQGKDMYPRYTHEPETYFAYLDDAVNVLQPDVYMYDQYPFYRQGTATNFYENLELIRQRSLETGVPCMNWLQGFAWGDGPFDVPSESQLRLQAFVSLAYGHKGFSYWSYSSPYNPYSVCILNHSGQPSSIGNALRDIIPEIRTLGETMKMLTNTGVYYCPSMVFADDEWVAVQPLGTTQWTHEHTPDIVDVKVSNGSHGFVMSRFVDDDQQEYVMLVNTHHGYQQNAADTASTITVRFHYTVTALERLSRHSGEWETIPLFQHTLLHYTLPGGTGDLFRIVKE